MIDRLASISSTNMSNSGQRVKTTRDTKSEPVQQNGKEPQPTTVSKQKLNEIVNAMNKFVSASTTHLKFELHDRLQEYYVKIIDDNTQVVVREIPSKKLLDMYAAMNDYLGVLVDKKI